MAIASATSRSWVAAGWEVYHMMKPLVQSKYAMLSAIPVSSERAREIYNGGICAYIMKPFSRNELVHKVAAVLKDN